MKSKKSAGASLEKKRIWFLQMGLVVACSIVLVSFEWRKPVEADKIICSLTPPISLIEEELAPIPIPKRPEVKKPKPEVIIDMPIDVVDDIPDFDPLDLVMPDEDISDPAITDIAALVEPTGSAAEPPIDFLPYGDMPYIVDCYNSRDKKEQKECTDIKIHEILMQNMSYPDICREQGIQGTVYVSFVINTDGKITNITLERGVHPLLDEEALNAVKALPEFVAGNQRGRKVPVLYRMPLSFKLQN